MISYRVQKKNYSEQFNDLSVISYTEVMREVRNSFLYVFNIPLLGNFGMEVGGVWREVGNEEGVEKGAQALALRAVLSAGAELLAWLEARPVRNAEAVKFLFILPFLPPQKTHQPHSLYLIFFFFISPLLLKLHALGALLWDVKNEKS